MLAARKLKLQSERLENPSIDDGQILSRLICYTSKLVARPSDAPSSLLIETIIPLGSFVCGESRSDRRGQSSATPGR